MAFSYTNRKGRAYFLHAKKTKNGKTRYIFSRTVGKDALVDVPEGYEVRENVNGIVSLARTQRHLITDIEQQAVRSSMARMSLDTYRLEVRGDVITIFESDRSSADIKKLFASVYPFGPSASEAKDWEVKGNYSPVLRFVLDDKEGRIFHVERMTYRGDGGWSYPLAQGRIVSLAEKYLRHLGKDSFFDLH